MTATNTVDINADALLADAQRALAGAAPTADVGAAGAPPADGAPLDPLAAQSWRPLIEGLVPTLRMTAFAQWNIRPEMEAEFIASMSQSLDVLFPGGMDGKYAPMVRVLACSAGIAFANYTPGEGFRPLGPKKPDEKKPAADAHKIAA